MQKFFLIANYPEFYFGACIKQIDGGDFTIIAVPEYYEMEYQTDNRAEIINIITKGLLKED